MSKRDDSILRIGKRLCKLMDDDWQLGRTFCMIEAEAIYDAEFADKTWTIYWRTGQRELVVGRTKEDALNAAGYGAGAVSVMDFIADGDNQEYTWDRTLANWSKIRIFEVQMYLSAETLWRTDVKASSKEEAIHIAQTEEADPNRDWVYYDHLTGGQKGLKFEVVNDHE